MNVGFEIVLCLFLCFVGVYSSLNVGDVCYMNDGTTGVCSLHSTCLKGRKRCGFYQRQKVVCCPNPPPTSTAVDGIITISRSILPTPAVPTTKPHRTPPSIAPISSISKSKCAEYSRHGYEVQRVVVLGEMREIRVPRCLTSRKMVVGGERALPKEFPHMAILGDGIRTNISWFCGGSLISERFILTAAHCFDSKNVTWVRLGDLNLVTNDDDARPETVSVDWTLKHPLYRRRQHYNDIGLIKLARDITFSAYIRPACLHTSQSERPGTDVIATGWGRNDSNEVVGTNDLMKVTLQTRTYLSCNNMYKHLRRSSLTNGITIDMVCAGDRNKDTCQGDSGGPLQIKMEGCMYSILGVTSFGLSGCGVGNSSGVYTRVSSFIAWIEENVWPETAPSVFDRSDLEPSNTRG